MARSAAAPWLYQRRKRQAFAGAAPLVTATREKVQMFLMSRLLLSALFLSSAVFATAEAADTPERYIVKFRGVSDETSIRTAATRLSRQKAVAAATGTVVLELDRHQAIAAKLNLQAKKVLQARADVLFVEADKLRYPLAEVTPYGISLVQADQVAYAGDPGTKVCVIDSGIDLGHPDLPGAERVTGNSSVPGPWFEDVSGHGSHVTGTITAVRNEIGVRGVVAQGNAQIHVYRVFDDANDSVPTSELISAVDDCVARGAQVVNMSLGCSGTDCFSEFEQQAFAEHYNNGVLFVAAAGNDGNAQRSYPAAHESVIAVGAIDESKNIASFSQTYAEVELVAPGVSVLSTVPRGTGFGADLDVAGNTFEAAVLEGSPAINASGEMVFCGLADTLCPAAVGRICLIERGTFLFSEKAQNCQDSGGIGAIIYNNVPGSYNGTLGELQPTIPVIGVSDSVGASLRILEGEVATLAVGPRDYDRLDGTSMATPHVTGVAALLWGATPSASNIEIRKALQEGALDLGTLGRDSVYGFGMVQAGAAFTALDADNDGITGWQDNCPDTLNPDQSDNDSDGSGDACDTDDDNDGVSDAHESVLGTDPLVADTDGDSLSDGFERELGLDPLDPNDCPADYCSDSSLLRLIVPVLIEQGVIRDATAP